MKRKAFTLLLLFVGTGYGYAQYAAKEIEKDLERFALNLDTNPDAALVVINSAYVKSIALEND